MGKAKRFNSYDSDVEQKRKLVKSYGQQRQNLSGIGSSFRSSPLSPSVSTVSSSNFISINGGNMSGPIAFFPKLITISSGAIDIGETTDNYSSRVIITPESGSTDDLVTITGAKHAGQLLIIQGIATYTLTLKNSGNIETINGNDFDIEDDDNIMLIFDSTDNKWQQITMGKQITLSSVNTWTGINAFTGTSFSITSPSIFIGDGATDSINITGRIATNIIIDSGGVIKSYDSEEIGYQVTNGSQTVGANGSLQSPVYGTVTVSKSTLDTQFGNLSGNFGYIDTGSGNITLYFRQADGNWAGVSLTRDTAT